MLLLPDPVKDNRLEAMRDVVSLISSTRDQFLVSGFYARLDSVTIRVITRYQQKKLSSSRDKKEILRVTVLVIGALSTWSDLKALKHYNARTENPFGELQLRIQTCKSKTVSKTVLLIKTRKWQFVLWSESGRVAKVRIISVFSDNYRTLCTVLVSNLCSIFGIGFSKNPNWHKIIQHDGSKKEYTPHKAEQPTAKSHISKKSWCCGWQADEPVPCISGESGWIVLWTVERCSMPLLPCPFFLSLLTFTLSMFG